MHFTGFYFGVFVALTLLFQVMHGRMFTRDALDLGNLAKVGCFNDKHGNVRPLPELLITDRDESSEVYGKKIEWSNWDSYLRDLVARCAEAAKRKGYKAFGVQYYGECWSGVNANTFANDGLSSTCVDESNEKCNNVKSKVCAGEENTNYVYIIKS